MRGIAPLTAILALVAGSSAAAAEVIWSCEVLHFYELGRGGTHEPAAPSRVDAKSFTVNDDTGEVAEAGLPLLSKDWKKVPRRFGPDQDGLQAVYISDGRQLRHLYVETFATGPVKPFLMTELDIGATRTGTCRAGR